MRARAAMLLVALAACGGGAATVTGAPDGGMDGTSPATPVTPIADGGGDDAASDVDSNADAGAYPVGVTWGDDALHFRLRSDPATRVELDVYAAATGADEVARYVLARDPATNLWGAEVARSDLAALGITGAVLYGYRAWGPNWTYDPSWTKGSSAGFVADVDGAGNRFDPNKLLIDPYAREISHDPLQPGAASSTPYMTGSARAIDSGRAASKSVTFPPDTSSTGAKPARAFEDDVVYEVHLRGLTKGDTTLGASAGTYAGAAARATSLAALGVTAVELLPIHETQNDTNDGAEASANYWGYETLAYFAPDRRYAEDQSEGGPTREFKAMVAAFHAAGIKVLLDVVYNHTAEGGVSASGAAETLSLRGLDNAGYYELAADHATPVDDTGTGGNVNAASDAARALVMDSLTYWTGEMGVDGFRFDLAAVLGNTCTSVCFTYSNADPAGILERAATELAPGGTVLVAEPWGVGTGTYQLGSFPAGWSEWNGNFRDTIRQAQNELGTTAIAPSTLAARITGSPDLFDHDGRAPSASVDYVDCHDGFTLRDEYAYDAPDNTQAYPLGPSSGGSTTNDSWDQGGAASAQLQAQRTALALVAVANGVPMIQGGDEFLRSQSGNDNAYNLDDSAMWLDPQGPTKQPAFVAWTSALFAFRAAHPALRPRAFFDGTDHDGNGLPDIGWLDTTGAAASSAYLADTTNHFLAWRIDGHEAKDTVRSVYVAWNAWSSDLPVTLPAAASGMAWYDAGDSASGTFAKVGGEPALGATSLTVKARSVAVLVER